MYQTLLGRPLEHWIDIDRAMAQYGVKGAKELIDRLSFNTTPMVGKGVVVVDANNPSRVLGRIADLSREELRHGTVFNMAVRPLTMRAYAYHDPIEMCTTVKVIRFAVGRVSNDGGWTFIPRLETNEPLADLMKLDRFRLPEETERQAYERLRMA